MSHGIGETEEFSKESIPPSREVEETDGKATSNQENLFHFVYSFYQ